MMIRGKVKTGLGLGKKLGYPTANLEIYGGKAYGAPEALPRDIQSGVYAARTVTGGASYHAVTVVGARREDKNPLLEAHLLDFEEDLSGKDLEVEILDKLSEIEKFESEEALKKKIEADIRKARLCLRG